MASLSARSQNHLRLEAGGARPRIANVGATLGSPRCSFDRSKRVKEPRLDNAPMSRVTFPRPPSPCRPTFREASACLPTSTK
jgi:hypothetical protein